MDSLTECSVVDGSDNNTDVYETVFAELGTTLTLYGVVAVLLLVAFEKLRIKNPRVYASRQEADPKRAPPQLPQGFLKWLPELLAIEESEVLRIAGFDGYMVIRFLRYNFRLCLFALGWGAILLWPIYFTSDKYNYSLFGQLTMANIPSGSPRLWAPCVTSYVLTLFALWSMLEEWELYVKCKLDYLTKGDPDVPVQSLYTIRVEKLPARLRNDEALSAYFERFFPGNVFSACVQLKKTKKLETTVARCEDAALEFEIASSTVDNKTSTFYCLCCPACKKEALEDFCEEEGQKPGLPFSRTVQSLPYSKHDFEKKKKEVELAQSRILLTSYVAETRFEPGNDACISSVGFVTFNRKASTIQAAQVMMGNTANETAICEASDLRDLIWANVAEDLGVLEHRNAIVSFIVKVFAVVAFIPLLVACNVVRLTPGVPFVIAGGLPPIFQATIVGSLPTIFTAIATGVEKVKLHSQAQRSTLDRSFGYQLVNIYFTLIGSSLASTLGDIAKEPSCIFALLGEAVPLQAGYFIQLILIYALFGLPGELCQYVHFAKRWWFDRNASKGGGSKTAEQRFRDDVLDFDIMKFMPTFLLVAILGFTYAVIAPFLSIITCMYFSFAYVTVMHNTLYVYKPRFQSGGALFPSIYGHMLTGINFANVTMMGYMIIKGGFLEFILLLPIVPMVQLFRGHANRQLKRCKILGLNEAFDFDDAMIESAGWIETFNKGLFRQPALKFNPHGFKPVTGDHTPSEAAPKLDQQRSPPDHGMEPVPAPAATEALVAASAEPAAAESDAAAAAAAAGAEEEQSATEAADSAPL